MPAIKREPVLSLAIANINKIDTVDCDRLSSLWTVFTKCAENLENGRRLENLSWRLWYRECQLCEISHSEKTVVTNDTDVAVSTHRKRESVTSSDDASMPDLSSSVESVTTDDDVGQQINIVTPRPQLSRLDSKLDRKHLTPDKLQELVTKFGQEPAQYEPWKGQRELKNVKAPRALIVSKEACKIESDSTRAEVVQVEKSPLAVAPAVCGTLSSPLQQKLSPKTVNRSSPTVSSPSQQKLSPKTINRSPPKDPLRLASQRTVVANEIAESLSAPRRASSVVHGFNPVEAICTIKSPSAKTNNKNMFFIQSSPSESSYDESSRNPKGKKRSLSRANRKKSPAPTKRTSFKEIVKETPDGYDSSPFESDDEEDEDESAISDGEPDSAIVTDEEVVEGDDGEDWDSVYSESRAPSRRNSNLFEKMEDVDSRPLLKSQKSLLSTLLVANPRPRLQNHHSRSSPAIAQSRQQSPLETPSELKGAVKDHGVGQLIRTQSAAIEGAQSPRTTRRNMLASELSESLRRHLLWERQQKQGSSTMAAAAALLKRRHTAHDMTKLTDYPEPETPTSCKSPGAIADNQFDYHQTGW